MKKKTNSNCSGCDLKQKIIYLSSIMTTFTLLLVGCNQTTNPNQGYNQNQQSYGQQQQYYQYPQQYGQMQPMNNSVGQNTNKAVPTTPKSSNGGGYSGGSTQKATPSYGGGGTGQTGYNAMGNWWGNMWGGDTNTGYDNQGYYDPGYYPGYDTGNYGYDSGNYGGYDYGSGYSDDYANQTYQEIYENRAATNQEINDNTSQWLYEGEANYINPETGELESKDYTNGDWYQTSEGDQYQTDDSSYTPDYSSEQQMEQYGGWASDYSPSDYGYDSGGGYDSGSYDSGGYDE